MAEQSEQTTVGSKDLGLALGTLQAQMAELGDQMSKLLEVMLNRPTEKTSYTTKEVADILGKAPFTIREWCRLKRIHAEKAKCGRGSEEEWRISREELVRIQNEGLLPIPDRY